MTSSERLTLDVDALPEGLRRDQDRVDLVPKALEQALARSFSLHEHRIGQARRDPLGQRVEPAVRRREDERRPCETRQSASTSSARRVVAGRARLGKGARDIEKRLLPVVVRRWQRDLAGVVEPEPGTEEPRLERRRDEDADRLTVPEKVRSVCDTSMGAQASASCSAQETASSSSTARQARGRPPARASAAPADRARRSRLAAPPRAGRAPPRSLRPGPGGLGVGRGQATAAAAGIEPESSLASPVDGVERARRQGPRALAAGALDVAEQPAQAPERDAAAEPCGGALLQPGGLAEDDRRRARAGRRRRRPSWRGPRGPRSRARG